MTEGVPLRQATPRDIALLPELERASDSIFESIGIWPLPRPARVEDYVAAAVVIVAGDPPVGFARIDVSDGAAHLEQLSVHPDAMRRGIGSRLLLAAVAWARDNGYDAITLATFRDVRWNAPFYAKHGFEIVAADTDVLRRIEEHERELGMPELGARVLMRRLLGATTP